MPDFHVGRREGDPVVGRRDLDVHQNLFGTPCGSDTGGQSEGIRE